MGSGRGYTPAMTSLGATTRAVLQELGAKPSKKLGQNFLVQEATVAAIVRLIDPQPDDQIIEVGGGIGTLTAALAPRVSRLVVFEVDRVLKPWLEQQFADQPQVTVLGDALAEWSAAGALLSPDRSLKIVGNIPYQITGPLLERALSDTLPVPWQSITFMVQEEVADRMLAAAGEPERGKLSVIVELHALAGGRLPVGRDAFHPKPNVDSLVLQLRPRPVPLLEAAQIPRFQGLLSRGFHMRRKTVWNNLRAGFGGTDLERLKGYLESNGVPLMKRPQDLTLREWLKAFWVEEELRS